MMMTEVEVVLVYNAMFWSPKFQTPTEPGTVCVLLLVVVAVCLFLFCFEFFYVTKSKDDDDSRSSSRSSSSIECHVVEPPIPSPN